VIERQHYILTNTSGRISVIALIIVLSAGTAMIKEIISYLADLGWISANLHQKILALHADITESTNECQSATR